MKKIIRNSVWLFLVAAIIIGLDQYTKWLVYSNLTIGEAWSPWEWLMPYARFVYWKNTGVAFGLLQGMNTVFIVLASIVSLGIIYYYQSIPKVVWLIRLALMLELGGAVGNLIDRIKVGYVIDFISLGNFPVFNVADSCITVGVFILLIGVWVQERREKQQNKPDPEKNETVNETQQ